MAEAILSVVLDQLTSFIRNEVEQEVRLVVGVREELNNLHTHLTLIKAVLEDAEKKEIHDNAIKVWLGQLKDVMYDAEDVLDEWNTRILISANGPHVANRVRSYLLSLCACFKHVGVRHDIAHRIKGIREGLDVIAHSKNQLGLVQSHNHHEEPRQLTSSVVDVSVIFGRDHDKQEILSKLLCETSQQETQVRTPILSIVGTGGFGKTTLAQLVYKEATFELKIWVCVSDPFDLQGTRGLKYYPRGSIERLSQLRTLSKFVVSDGSNKGSVIGELGNLNFLKGSLDIMGLRHVKSVNEAKEAQLQKKNYISDLWLNFQDDIIARDIGPVSNEEEIRRMEGVLENLEPHKESLERLVIRYYAGSTLPTWMRMMSNITSLSLYYCPNLMVEPHYLFPPRLETLELFYDVGVLSKSLMSLTHNNNLKSLQISSSPHSSLPQGLNQLTSLQQLTFYSCEFLDFKPEELKPLTMLRKLEISYCNIITRERSREEDWSILTHVPIIEIDRKDIKKSRN
ncbi:hypothetical protein IFM89_038074 [Coptis chinensis]|uniref:Uncharacterized protein n=1 Tax=Coptis chinensis TaxID=261450 RepID=A0A835I3S7_9MAGN|nr:hypothetical protein IFM89_038074 [Coptis chinensis]